MLDDYNSLCIVRECQDLEATYETAFTDEILNGEEVCMCEAGE